MKTSIKTLFAAALTTIILSSATIANATETRSNYTNLTSVKNISKIKISGNVKLILVQDAKESVMVYDNYYSKNALVQQQDGELRISSFNKEPLTVIAHVNNISSIEASNTSSVSTSGSFNLISLKVALHDLATANINANTVNLNTTVNNGASLSLSGYTDSYTAILGTVAKVNMNNFSAADSNVSTAPVYSYNASRYEDLKVDLLESLF
ncbi:GIN domain-containing protein [Pedobacter punctiformis]|uniref:DUF2807 domain-containing protein n=1 Tax=Pedobacter punctiformis TaxID=3004097 RepID=A0ABT4L5I9_9SPHI|nr:DUF2807 domain-containing protein [Pedobacter sp. HCMS5-2]MCZ4243189.1 DUF2807 domain-containing protein [Pedobacter sp. HCMS5-2]